MKRRNLKIECWLALGAALVLMGGAQAQATPDAAVVVTPLISFAAQGQAGRVAVPPIWNHTDSALLGVQPARDGIPYRIRQVDDAWQLEAGDPVGLIRADTGMAVDAQGNVFFGASGLSFGTINIPHQVFRWGLGQWPQALPEYAALGDSRPVPKGLFAVDPQGNVYFGGGSGTTHMLLQQRTPQGQIVPVVDFKRYADGPLTSAQTAYLKGTHTGGLLYSEDDGGTLYGYTYASNGRLAGDPAAVPENDRPIGTVIRVRLSDLMPDGTSNVDVLHTFAQKRDGAPQVLSEARQHGIVEDGQWLYGTTERGVWRMRKQAPHQFTLLHVFGSGANGVSADEDGLTATGQLVRALDGNIYGVTSNDGSVRNTSGAAVGAGTLFRIEPGSQADRSDDVYRVLHRFAITRDGARPVGLTDGPVVGNAQYLFGATAAGTQPSDTISTGGTAGGDGGVFSVAVSLPPVTISRFVASAQTVTAGERPELRWETVNAAACEASDGDLGVWTGARQAQDAEQLPALTIVGTHTFQLVCSSAAGLRSEPASVSITVQAAPEPEPAPTPTPPAPEDNAGSGGGGGGALSLSVLLAFAAAAARRRRHAA